MIAFSKLQYTDIVPFDSRWIFVWLYLWMMNDLIYFFSCCLIHICN